jgi:monothiol glutaredoxin
MRWHYKLVSQNPTNILQYKEFIMSENPVFDRIQSEIDSNDVVLFMKGSPMFPQCGFSAAISHALTTLEIKFKSVDVLEDGDIRNGIKDFTNWPTIPQLYLKGEFVGGCDIIREMFEAGELQQLFKEKGIEITA